MSQSFEIDKIVADIPTITKQTDPNLAACGGLVIDRDKTLWVANSGNSQIFRNVTHYDQKGKQLSDVLTFSDVSLIQIGPTTLQVTTISDLLWLQKNILFFDQGIIIAMPTLYKTAPMLGIADQQPSSYETSLNQFMNAPNGYLGPDVDISFLINWCVNNPNLSITAPLTTYLSEAHSINLQLLLDLHNDSLIFDYGVALTNAQSSIPVTITSPQNMTQDVIVGPKQITPLSSLPRFNPGLPIGLVFNETDGFVKSLVSNFIGGGISNTDACLLIAAISNGKIYTYNPLTHVGDNYHMTLNIDDSDDHSVYTGVTMANNNLYLADLANLRIRTYDYKWGNIRQLNEHGFRDPDLPVDYSPFNVCAINGLIFVLYGLLNLSDPLNVCCVNFGPGLGIINIFTTNGTFVKRAVSHGPLNAPWGLTFHDDHYYVGNHGDGQIHVYDQNWQYVSRLRFPEHDPSIEPSHDRHHLFGLFGLFSEDDQIYFVSRPTDQHGLLGSLSSK